MNPSVSTIKFMKKIITLLAVLLMPAALLAQHNSFTLSGVGNFPPTNYVDLNPKVFSFPLLVSSNRAAAGVAGEYDYNYTPHFAVGVFGEYNPSDGKLLEGTATTHPVYSIWPLSHYEMAGMLTQTAPLGTSNIWIYIQEGLGAIITNGPTNSGLSHDIGFYTGTGVDWRLYKNWSLKVGALFINSHTGCYDGVACTDEWGVLEEAHVGVKYSW